MPPISGTAPQPLILIVDDDLAVRDSLAALIESFGFRTRTAANGREGMEAVESEVPSAIITDLHMPEMDGFELLRALQISEIQIPVIVISGCASRGCDFLSAARHMGAAATFQKPFPVQDMIATINGLTAEARV